MDQDRDLKWLDEEKMLELFQQYQGALEAGLSIDAEDSIQQICDMAVQWCENEQPPGWDSFVEAMRCELCGDWQGAEAAYQKNLAEASDSPIDRYSAHRDLARFYGLWNDEAKQLHHCRLAAEAGCQVESRLVPLMALSEYAAALLGYGRFGDAQRIVDDICTRLERENDKQLNQLRARALVLRAICWLNASQYSAADNDLQIAFELIEPISHVESACGVQDDLASWWSTVGKLRTARGDHSDAVQAWQRAVEIRRSIHAQYSQPHGADGYTAAALSRTLDALAVAHFLAGDQNAASLARIESREIRSALKLPIAKDFGANT